MTEKTSISYLTEHSLEKAEDMLKKIGLRKLKNQLLIGQVAIKKIKDTSYRAFS